MGIFPQNDSQLVLQLVKRLGEDGQALIQLKPINAGSGEGFGPVTLETAFLYFLDITNPPRPSVLKVS